MQIKKNECKLTIYQKSFKAHVSNFDTNIMQKVTGEDSKTCWGHLSQLMRLWDLSHRRPVKAQASLGIRAVSPEPSLFAHMKYGSRREIRPKIRHLSRLDGCTCAFEECVNGGQKVP